MVPTYDDWREGGKLNELAVGDGLLMYAFARRVAFDERGSLAREEVRGAG